MALSDNAKNALTHGVANYNAAQEIITALNTATAGVAPQDISTTASPTFVGLTLTGNENITGTLAVTGTATLTGVSTAAGNVNVASGKVYKVNGVQVVGAQQALVPPIVVTYTGTPPTPGTTQSITIDSVSAADVLQYCVNLDARLSAINVLLKTHGLEASS